MYTFDNLIVYADSFGCCPLIEGIYREKNNPTSNDAGEII